MTKLVQECKIELGLKTNKILSQSSKIIFLKKEKDSIQQSNLKLVEECNTKLKVLSQNETENEKHTCKLKNLNDSLRVELLKKTDEFESLAHQNEELRQKLENANLNYQKLLSNFQLKNNVLQE